MAPIEQRRDQPLDLFYSPEDRHRIVLLQQVLEDGGVALRLHTEGFSGASKPVLGVLSEHVEPWMVRQAVACADELIWLRLDHSPLPAPARQALALQNWPGRSADLAIAELIEALRSGWQPPAQGVDAEVGAGQRVAASGFAAVRSGRFAREVVNQSAEWTPRLVGLLVLLLLAFGVWGLTRLTPEPQSAQAATDDTGQTGRSLSRPTPFAEARPGPTSMPSNAPAAAQASCIELAKTDPVAASALMPTLSGLPRLACRVALAEPGAEREAAKLMLSPCMARGEELRDLWQQTLRDPDGGASAVACLGWRAARSPVALIHFSQLASQRLDAAGA